MSEEMQTPETRAQVNRLIPGTELITSTDAAGAEQRDAKDEQSPVDGVEAQPAEDSSMAPAENVATVDDDATEVELVTRLQELLTKDVELSARYVLLLRNHRKTRRERRAMRAELRQLHTDEGGILLDIKLHLARKGRAGGWAEFLRQRKPKALSRTTADRWIQWSLDSQKRSEPPGGQEENAPQNTSGAFSGGSAQSPPVSTDAQQPVVTDPPSANGSEAFDDVQQVVLALKKSQAVRFKAAAEFLVGKNALVECCVSLIAAVFFVIAWLLAINVHALCVRLSILIFGRFRVSVPSCEVTRRSGLHFLRHGRVRSVM